MIAVLARLCALLPRVRRDDALVEALRAGLIPTGDPLTRALGAWVADVREGT